MSDPYEYGAMSTPATFTPEQVKPLLEPLVAKITERANRLAAELAADREDKNAANVLCRMAGQKEIYALDASGAPVDSAAPGTALRFKVDQFVGLELSEAVSQYLEARKANGSVEAPATIDEIYDALLSGGFKFGGNTDNPANHKRAMNIALTRNTAQMHKINENTFGLRRWYGMRAPRKMVAASSASGQSSSAAASGAPHMEIWDDNTPSASSGGAADKP